MDTSKKSVVALSFIFLFFSVFLTRLATNSTTVWLGNGTYAEYNFVSGGIEFLNGSITSEVEGIYRWKCISLNEGVAELNVTFVYSSGTQCHSSVQVHVDTQTRDITSHNGSLIGKTFLWLPPYMNENQSVILAGTPSNYLIGKVIHVLTGNDHVSTPQGGQNAFIVEAKETSATMGIIAIYDLDTGLLVSWGPGTGEATLLALNVSDLNVRGSIALTDTNVVLGPKILWPEISMNILIAVSLGFFMAVFITVYRKRTRLRQTFRSRHSLSYTTDKPVGINAGPRVKYYLDNNI